MQLIFHHVIIIGVQGSCGNGVWMPVEGEGSCRRRRRVHNSITQALTPPSFLPALYHQFYCHLRLAIWKEPSPCPNFTQGVGNPGSPSHSRPKELPTGSSGVFCTAVGLAKSSKSARLHVLSKMEVSKKSCLKRRLKVLTHPPLLFLDPTLSAPFRTLSVGVQNSTEMPPEAAFAPLGKPYAAVIFHSFFALAPFFFQCNPLSDVA